jgi:hypothetical protein
MNIKVSLVHFYATMKAHLLIASQCLKLTGLVVKW